MFAGRISAVHRNENKAGAGEAVEAFHALMTVIQENGDPIPFLEPQTEKKIGHPIDSLQ
jgi:hypothetical protein